MKSFFKILLTAIVIIGLATIFPGITVTNYLSAIIIAITIAILNTIVKPILVFFTLPATIVTFGLFLFVINACVILIADYFISNFYVDGFWYALLFSICLTAFRSLLFKLTLPEDKKNDVS